MATKKCLKCNREFSRKPRFNKKWWAGAKYCSVTCSAASKIGKPSGMLGKVAHNRGKKMSEAQKLKLSLALKGRTVWNKGKINEYSLVRSKEGKESFREKMSGRNNHRWIVDRTKLAKRQERNDSAYKEWRKSVRDRDHWKCKISNGDCLGKVVAHHILTWSKFPELRYNINNGITLCRFHHPRKRSDEMKLSPYFQKLLLSNRN